MRDPLTLALQAHPFVQATDAEAAEWLNRQQTTRYRDAPSADVAEHLRVMGLWSTILLIAGDETEDQHKRGLCIAVRDTITQTQVVRFSDPNVRASIVAALDGLRVREVITAEQQASLMALVTETGPVWNPPVTAAQVAQARIAATSNP